MRMDIINYVSKNGQWTELEKLSPEERRTWSRILLDSLITVSYTHLDVYKRQVLKMSMAMRNH